MSEENQRKSEAVAETAACSPEQEPQDLQDVQDAQDAQDVQKAQPAAEEPEKRKGRKQRKLPLILGVIAVVIVAAGVGFFVWHEQPSFCNTICHSPMDAYVESFYVEDEGSLAARHRVAGEACLICHKPTLEQQIGEGISWLTGNFTDPIGDTGIGTRDFCLSCHDLDDIKAATTAYSGIKLANPHDSNLGAQQCSDCHSVHGTSVLYCSDCHFLDKPEGWLTPSEIRAMS